MNAISNSHLLVSIVISDLSGDGYLKNMYFLGSGITIYNRLYDAVNASFAIDGSSPQSYVDDVSCNQRSPPGCYNISVYNAQSLTFDNHILNITLFNYNDAASEFAFDYAIVNDTNPAVITSSTSSSTATSTGSSTSPNTAASTGNRAPPSHASQYVFPSSLAVDS